MRQCIWNTENMKHIWAFYAGSKRVQKLKKGLEQWIKEVVWHLKAKNVNLKYVKNRSLSREGRGWQRSK